MSESQDNPTRQEQAEQLHKQYGRVFSGIDGETVLADLRRYSGYDACLFVPGTPDRTAYNLGARDMMLYILAKLAELPEEPIQDQVKTESSLDKME